MSYKFSKLEKITKIRTGKLNSNAAKENGDFPFFTCDPTTLRTNTFSFDTTAVLLAGNNASGDYSAKYYCGKFEVYQRTYVIESINKDVLNVRYLSYAMTQELSRLKTMSAGSTTKFLKIGMLHNLEIPLPSIEVQRCIANILSSYDELIENNQKQIKLLEEAAMRLYKKWFINLQFPGYESVKIDNGVPKGWKRKKLIEIADIQYGFAFDSRKFNNLSKGTPIIRIRNIPSGNTSDFTTELTDDKYLVHNGDIVVGMDGEFHINTWCGKTSYLVQRSCRIKPKNRSMDGYILQSIYGPIKLFEKTLVGATVSHLGKKHIETITLLEPPEELYLPFQYIFENRQLLLNQNTLLRQARDNLIPKLMSGEIEV